MNGFYTITLFRMFLFLFFLSKKSLSHTYSKTSLYCLLGMSEVRPVKMKYIVGMEHTTSIANKTFFFNSELYILLESVDGVLIRRNVILNLSPIRIVGL